MRYYKIAENGYIAAAGRGRGNAQISEEKYSEILEAVRNRPAAPEGHEYRLTQSLEWELCEAPAAEDTDSVLTEAEALDIILGGAL